MTQTTLELDVRCSRSWPESSRATPGSLGRASEHRGQESSASQVVPSLALRALPLDAGQDQRPSWLPVDRCSGANPSPSSALRRGMPVNVVWTDGRSYPPVVSTWDARGVVVAFPNGQTNMVPLRAVRLRGPEFDVRSTVVVQSRVIERQTMVIRCKHCGEITALDGSRCRNCGSPSFK